jgi:peptidoglycan biosynthesis protein MviN/MurJ (putative lipid II flippase)
LKAAGLQTLDVRVYSVNPIVTVSLSLIAIPFLGGVGAALSKLVATLCSSALRIYAVAREVAPLGWFGIVAKPLAIAGAAAACSALLVGVVPVAARALVYAFSCALLLWLTRAFSFDALKAALGSPSGQESVRAGTRIDPT